MFFLEFHRENVSEQGNATISRLELRTSAAHNGAMLCCEALNGASKPPLKQVDQLRLTIQRKFA